MDIWRAFVALHQTNQYNNLATLSDENQELQTPPIILRNTKLDRSLELETLAEIIKNSVRSHEGLIRQHVNIEAIHFLNNTELMERVQTQKTIQMNNVKAQNSAEVYMIKDRALENVETLRTLFGMP